MSRVTLMFNIDLSRYVGSTIVNTLQYFYYFYYCHYVQLEKLDCLSEGKREVVYAMIRNQLRTSNISHEKYERSYTKVFANVDNLSPSDTSNNNLVCIYDESDYDDDTTT